MMKIQNNLMALNAQRQTQLNTLMLKSSLQKLSSGYRVNSAADDAAGLAISEAMRAQITGTERAIMNAQDGVSFAQTAEGALSEVHSMLNRMTDLSTQAANGLLSSEQRASIQSEADALKSEIDRIAGSTNFNGTNILDGSLSATASQPVVSGVQTGTSGGNTVIDMADLTVFDGSNAAAATFEVDGEQFMLADSANYANAVSSYGSSVNVVQVSGSTGSLTGSDLQAVSAAVNTATGNAFEADSNGIAVRSQPGNPLQLQIGETADETMQVSIDSMSSASLGVSGIDLTTVDGANQALTAVRSALNRVSSTRGDIGAAQNRLEHTIDNLGVKNENIQAAESRIRDADMAKTLMEFTKRNILQQTGMAMQSHGQMQSQQVLQLLR